MQSSLVDSLCRHFFLQTTNGRFTIWVKRTNRSCLRDEQEISTILLQSSSGQGLHGRCPPPIMAEVCFPSYFINTTGPKENVSGQSSSHPYCSQLAETVLVYRYAETLSAQLPINIIPFPDLLTKHKGSLMHPNLEPLQLKAWNLDGYWMKNAQVPELVQSILTQSKKDTLLGVLIQQDGGISPLELSNTSYLQNLLGSLLSWKYWLTLMSYGVSLFSGSFNSHQCFSASSE